MSNKNGKSELEELLEKNAYGGGLDDKEFNRALELTSEPEVVNDDEECWVCSTSSSSEKNKPTIYDTGLCSEHTKYALVTRK
ncbi:MAG: hypothetical protein ABEK36_05045 [Candidatus Aenigmatarchaeota archaeon]